jgi:hypothetical protein
MVVIVLILNSMTEDGDDDLILENVDKDVNDHTMSILI